MGKKKHLMTFTRPAAKRKIEQIALILTSDGPMSKHCLARRIDVVSRTAQTYLAELRRRGEIHVSFYAARPGGGTPVAMWDIGPEPDDFVAQVVRAPIDPNREDPRSRRARRRAEMAASKAKAQRPRQRVDPLADPWHVHFWNMVNTPRTLTK